MKTTITAQAQPKPPAAPRGNKAGDIVFVAGRTELPLPGLPQLPDPGGSIIFRLGDEDETEVLRFSRDGSVTVRDSLVADDVAIYHAFPDWLSTAVNASPKGDA